MSYDPTRELYRDFNESFVKEWQARTGQEVTIKQSHGGSGSQARAVIDGLAADVVTLALAYDIDSIQRKGKRLGANWQTRFPDNSAPYTSTIVFLVRKGNPKQIRDWPDLIKPGVQVVTPNPKTSGGARWNYLAAWGAALQRELGDDWSKLDDPAASRTGRRGAGGGGAVSSPRSSPACRCSTAARAAQRTRSCNVRSATCCLRGRTKRCSRFGSSDLTRSNLSSLRSASSQNRRSRSWTPSSIVAARGRSRKRICSICIQTAGQEIAAKHYFRPRNAKVLERHQAQFASLKLFTINDVFGGWDQAHEKHFADGGVFDRIYRVGGKR